MTRESQIVPWHEKYRFLLAMSQMKQFLLHNTHCNGAGLGLHTCCGREGAHGAGFGEKRSLEGGVMASKEFPRRIVAVQLLEIASFPKVVLLRFA